MGKVYFIHILMITVLIQSCLFSSKVLLKALLKTTWIHISKGKLFTSPPFTYKNTG